MKYEALTDLFLEMEKMHPNFYKSISKKGFWEMVNQLKTKWNKLNEIEQNYEMLKINALIKDLHSWPLITIKEDVSYPFKVKRFNEQYYITNINKNEIDKNLLYSKIVSINGCLIDDIEKRLLPIITAECTEGKYSRVCSYITYPILLKMIKISTQDEIKIKLQNNNKFFELSLNPSIWKNENSLLNEDNNSKYEFRTLDRYNYFKISSFTGLCPCLKSEEIFNFNSKVSKELCNGNPFLVDLRDNQGGTMYSWVFPQILETISKNNIFGFCLINNNTMSSSVLMATDLKDKGFILVGEDAGQPSSFYAMGKPQNLPYYTTKFGINFNVSKQLCKVETHNFTALNDSALKCDVKIKTTIDDIKNNKDPVLEYCIEQITKKQDLSLIK